MSTKNLLLVIFSLATGVTTSSVLLLIKAQSQHNAILAYKTDRKNAEKINQLSVEYIDSLKEKAEVLQSTLTATEILLSKTKQKNRALRFAAVSYSLKPCETAPAKPKITNDSLMETVMNR
jgi:hypothetical protein